MSQSQRDDAVDAWFVAHDDYHKRSDAYNNRLTLVRAERDRGNWTMNCQMEYALLNEAQKKALAADETLYAALDGPR